MQRTEESTILEKNRENALEKEPETEKPGSDEINLKVFEYEEAFQELEKDWRKLAMKADVPVYISQEWISCWWKHFGRHPQRDPFIVAVRKGEELVGLAPLYKGRSAIGPINVQVRLHLMGCGTGKQEFLGFHDEYGRSDFLDMIVDPEYESEVAEHLVDFFQRSDLGIDVLALQHLRDSGFVKRKLIPLLEQRDISFDLEEADICPYVTLKDYDSMEEYLSELSSNTRRRLRQTLRAIGEEDGYRVEQVETQEELFEELAKLREMHQSRWNGFGYPGAFFDDRFVRFLNELVEKVYDKGWIWFKQAIDEGGYAATRLSIKYNNRFYDYMSGFDASCPSSKYRPGIGLLTLMIKEAIENNDPEIVELLRGDERYKFDLTSKVQKNWRLSIPLRTARNPIRKVLNFVMKAGVKIHAVISREWTLVKVQQHLKGTPMMFVNYLKTRYSMLKYKYQQE